MVRKIKAFFFSIFFIALTLVSLYGVNWMLRPKYTTQNSKWPTTASYEQFYKMKENSIDVLFFGSSLIVNSMIPQEFYNEYGITSYNLGSEQQSIFLSYYWLKEALRFQKPKVVVLDLYYLTDMHPENVINTTEPLTRKCLDPMRFSEVKKEAVEALCKLDPSQSELSYYLTNLRFHTRWELLEESDLNRNLSGYSRLKGYSPLTEVWKLPFDTYEPEKKKGRIVYPFVMQDYLEKTVDLCKENGIELVLIDLPRRKMKMDDARNNTQSTFAKEHGVTYYNLCSKEHYDKIGTELPWEYTINHQNLWGAIKTSRYLGKLLKKDFNLEPKKDAQYERTKDYYEQVKQSDEIVRITKDQVKYLKALDQPQLAVFMLTQGNASDVIKDKDVKAALKELGLECTYPDYLNYNFAAAIVSGKAQTEKTSEHLISEVGKFRDGLSRYTLTSGRDEQLFNIGSIQIDNESYLPPKEGLYILVYDMNQSKVIDQVTFSGKKIHHVNPE